MKLAITARIQKLFDRYRVRIAIGVVFSLLVHGLILSLQFGIPGFGLPSLELPWNERRAQTPELRVKITNLAISPVVESQILPQPPANGDIQTPQQALQQPSNNQPLTELPNAHTKQTTLRSASNSAQAAKALKSNPAIAQAVRNSGTPPPDDQSTPAPARSQQELIALTDNRASSFIVPAPDKDEWWRTAPKIDSTAIPVHPPEETAPPAIAMRPLKPSIEPAKEPAPAVQKPTEQESFERPDETQATEPEPAKIPDVAMELAARRQGEEIARQEAARKLEEQQAAQRAQDLETRKQGEARKQQADEAARLLAAQKLEEEITARRAEELLADAKRQILADAERQAKELEARKQTEEIARQQAAALALQRQVEAAQKQAEEVARQKATAVEHQKQQEQQEQLAAQQKTRELAARQNVETEAASQRENARLAAPAVTGNGTEDGNRQSGTSYQSNGLGAGNLGSRALEQIGKIGLTRVQPPLAVRQDHPEDNSRRRSIFGSIDHDIGLAMYIEGWRTKIERNGSLNYSQSSKDKAREDPVVTVAIRSDGSVEDIIINRSSGRADLDEAVRRIVRVNARYSTFPAGLARKYDVIEIRRVWNFDETLRILEEVH
jgi:hypothetical protein